ncbi:hypothetical protein RGQ29_029989 [Quercus rubra]|uniref:Disease resistance R13L4/SHOC-2-like LRR domain-containing protein n=1 Tax=Quercus rubra TaxID=3512 RepID=A0AAN7EGC2_QUERU|nr:hypothetical protein RGQ29_029989 [Quercus rubra]
MTMIAITSGGSLKLVHAFFILLAIVRLRPALGFISGVGVGDANNINCLEGERQALLEFKKCLVDDYGSNLKYLDLSWTNLTEPIPFQLENLLHLQYLNLSGNDLKIIDFKWLSHLSSLEGLALNSINLSSVANDWLEVVSHLPNLTTLSMSGCDLPPMSLSPLPHLNHSKSRTSLKSLDLSFNQLAHFPKSFGDISLESLDLSNNQLVHIPKSFGDICTLRELYLYSNNINGQLVELMNNLSGCVKDSLEVLDLSYNQITGLLPNFAIFPSLKEIDLIGNLYKLEVLSVSSNFLEGVISESLFSNLFKLQSLDLSNNSLSLEFSFDWVSPFQLSDIYLTSCNLGPRFPNWIRTQRKVSFLDISEANISDTISAELLEDLPPTLEVLNLSSNRIYGQLPNVSAKRLNGLAIYLSANSLEGPLPHFPTNLSILNLSKNQFSGSFSPLSKINGQLLAYLDLSHNKLSGRLPNCFMQWPKLVILNLAGNHFFGEVPSSLGSLSMLNTLSLNNNNFSGNLPSSLRNCSSLTVMDMRNNRFFGKVPAWIGEHLKSLIFLSLRSNMFNGSITLHLCWLKDLQILGLSLNDISGTIPQCLNNFIAMAQKRNYSFENSIPFSYYNGGTFGKLYFDSVMVELKRNEYEYHGRNLGLLKIINLSSNKLIGKLPSEISSLLDLISLNISRNNLIEEIPQMIGFDASYFIGNRELCGPPLTQKCPGEETPNRSEVTTKDNEEKDELVKWFYVGSGFGFAIGFGGVCGSLLLKRPWRHAYFLLLDNMKHWLYVTVTVNIARLQRKIQRQG